VLLQLKNVDVAFNGVIQVLRSVNLDVPEGRVVVLLGSNGAGKTTTLKSISSMLRIEHGRVTAGEITFDGIDVANRDPADVFRRGIVQVLEGRRVLVHLTVEQNLRIGAHLRSDIAEIRRDLDKVYGYFPRLTELTGRTAGYLSGGEMQMLLVGRALMARPRLLLLDEPSMGLARRTVGELFSVLERINREEKMTMLIVEQNATAAIGICHYGYVMENGRIVFHGDREKLASNDDVREFYLGLSLSKERKSFRDVKHYKRRKRWLG
jgi:branched-chain amino acid transport system ATP-binding protein